jgi:hypothetical protein
LATATIVLIFSEVIGIIEEMVWEKNISILNLIII